MWYYSAFQADIVKFIQTFANPFLDKFFVLATIMGEESFFMIAAVLIFWCVDKDFGYRLGFAYLSGNAICTGAKEAFRFTRPIGQPEIRSLRTETAGGYSFPSGHSQSAASFWTSVMVKLKKRWMYVLGPILILLVMLSRLYLGVHWPLDVLVGAALGIAWVFVSNAMFNYAERTGKKAIFLVFIIPMLILLFVLRYGDYYKSSGTLLAFYLGYLIEPKYIKYDVKASILIQIVKMAAGFGVLMAIRVFVKTLLLALVGIPADSPEIETSVVVMVCDFIRYFLMGVWVTIAAPYLFKKLFGRTAEMNKGHSV